MADASALEVPRAMDQKVTRSKVPQHARVVYDRAGPVDEQLQHLAQLYLSDKKAEKKRRVLAWTAGISGFLAFFTLVMGIGLVFLAIVAVSLIWRSRVGDQDLEDRKLHAARFVLETLAPELKPGRAVKLHLDFSGYHRSVPRFEDVGGGSGGRVHAVPGWLKMGFTLLDGTQVSVLASTSAKRKKRTKRKYTKIKDRIVEELEIELRAPSGRSFEAVSSESLSARFAGAHALTLKRCEVKARVAGFVFRTPRAERLRGRGGWEGSRLEALLDGHGVLEAIIASYKAVAIEAHERAAA